MLIWTLITYTPIILMILTWCNSNLVLMVWVHIKFVINIKYDIYPTRDIGKSSIWIMAEVFLCVVTDEVSNLIMYSGNFYRVIVDARN